MLSNSVPDLHFDSNSPFVLIHLEHPPPHPHPTATSPHDCHQNRLLRSLYLSEGRRWQINSMNLSPCHVCSTKECHKNSVHSLGWKSKGISTDSGDKLEEHIISKIIICKYIYYTMFHHKSNSASPEKVVYCLYVSVLVAEWLLHIANYIS